ATVPLVSKSALPTRPAPARSNSASSAPRGSEATAAIDPARGPRPNRCKASAASAFGSAAMRHCPLDRDAAPPTKWHACPQGRGVEIAAGHLSKSWLWDERLEGY